MLQSVLRRITPAEEATSNLEMQQDELTALAAIYERELSIVHRNEGRAASGAHSTSVDGSECTAAAASAESAAAELIDLTPGGSLELPPGAALELRVPLVDTTLDDQPLAQIRVPPALRKALPTLARGNRSGEGGEGGEGERGSTLSITALPPLSLRLRLPAAYPSRSPPVFGVRCAWLSDESLSTLCERLDAECAAAAGTAVICDLVEWLRTEALRALPADTLSPLRLPSEAGTEAGAEAAAAAAATNGGAAAATSKAASSSATASAAERLRGRAARWPRDDAEVLSSIIAHAQAADEAAWRDGLHDCGVCLETHASLDCIRFVRCRHTFCKACCSGYFAAQMAEGAASALQCPEPSCRMCDASRGQGAAPARALRKVRAALTADDARGDE